MLKAPIFAMSQRIWAADSAASAAPCGQSRQSWQCSEHPGLGVLRALFGHVLQERCQPEYFIASFKQEGIVEKFDGASKHFARNQPLILVSSA